MPLPFLAVTNNAFTNICKQVICEHMSSFLLVDFEIEFMFIFLGNCQNVFDSGCIILDANQQFMEVLGFLQYHQRLVLALFLIIGFSGCEL